MMERPFEALLEPFDRPTRRNAAGATVLHPTSRRASCRRTPTAAFNTAGSAGGGSAASVRTREVDARAIADLGPLIATRKPHATEVEAECRRALAADAQIGTPQVRSSFVG
ncbi:hypothetical protein [Methylobacterium sp. PvR107]|uniref:hypothetical protein n=1 Tax=Methylobacterium sp. PvR107 TaxID=2806597 RepID=UPI001AE2A2D6|nr:hypothetical protein [Methylobacterium sp. PvR107]MBP1179878.1 hypothetical protein [Methylobacterium sp. PvR107]